MRDYEKNKKYYPSVGISRQKIDAVQSQQKDLLLVGTDKDLVVTDEILCPDVALVYGALHPKVLVYTQYGQYICFFVHPGWVGLK